MSSVTKCAENSKNLFYCLVEAIDVILQNILKKIANVADVARTNLKMQNFHQIMWN